MCRGELNASRLRANEGSLSCLIAGEGKNCRVK